MAKGFKVDLNRCIGCDTCVIACKSEKNTVIKINYRWLMNVEGGTYPTPTRYWVSAACNHCADPACLEACPVDAITKRTDGIVHIDDAKCVGCDKCIWACPYGAPQKNSSTRKVEKCDMCMHLIDAGFNPACVSACPVEALGIDDAATLAGDSSLTADIAGMPSSSMTNPTTRYKDRS